MLQLWNHLHSPYSLSLVAPQNVQSEVRSEKAISPLRPTAWRAGPLGETLSTQRPWNSRGFASRLSPGRASQGIRADPTIPYVRMKRTRLQWKGNAEKWVGKWGCSGRVLRGAGQGSSSGHPVGGAGAWPPLEGMPWMPPRLQCKWKVIQISGSGMCLYDLVLMQFCSNSCILKSKIFVIFQKTNMKEKDCSCWHCVPHYNIYWYCQKDINLRYSVDNNSWNVFS